jgi:hypothetical protein
MKIHKLCIGTVLTAGAAFYPIQAFTPIQTKIHNPSLIVLKSTMNFKNEGPFSFMQPSLSLIGFQEGKTTYYGPAVDVDPNDYPSEEEQQRRRDLAQSQMYNIGDEERQRRKEAGELFQKISIAYAIFASLTDDGGIGGIATRFAVAIPLFLAVGYAKSAESGL